MLSLDVKGAAVLPQETVPVVNVIAVEWEIVCDCTHKLIKNKMIKVIFFMFFKFKIKCKFNKN